MARSEEMSLRAKAAGRLTRRCNRVGDGERALGVRAGQWCAASAPNPWVSAYNCLGVVCGV